MEIHPDKIRAFRLRTHHLDAKRPMEEMLPAAGACGLQNSPPGAWETALFNRLNGCTLPALHKALDTDKTLLQAWSFRGVPVVFPTGESGVFLTPLIGQEGEQPWIYTRGITGALDHLQMEFGDLLARTKKAAAYLDSHTVQSKETLDSTLAGLIEDDLPKEKLAAWRSPSIYGSPEKQTMGGAAVSFLLRPCSFYSLVVFGRRQGTSPTFTSYKNWVGQPPAPLPDGGKALVRKFLHCYGPATIAYFADWLGCCPQQAKRLWQGVAEEMEPVEVAGKTHYILAADRDSLLRAACDGEKLLLLGAHDPYLDIRDRAVLLEDRQLQKQVWKTVANPGAVVKGGRVVGTWKAKARKDKQDLTLTLWEKEKAGERRTLQDLAGEYAAFRQAAIQNCTVEYV